MGLERNLRRVAAWLGAGVSAVGLVVLAGWLTGSDPLRAFRPTVEPMKFNTALCLALAGASLALQSLGRARAFALAAAAGGLLVTTLTLAEWVFNVNLPFVDGLASGAYQFVSP